MSTQSITVEGMSCDHCIHAVTEELVKIDGVSNVNVTINPDGPSNVDFDADTEIRVADLAAAIDEAGYTLV